MQQIDTIQMRHSENFLRLACEEVRSRDERVYFYDKWFLV